MGRTHGNSRSNADAAGIVEHVNVCLRTTPSKELAWIWASDHTVDSTTVGRISGSADESATVGGALHPILGITWRPSTRGPKNSSSEESNIVCQLVVGHETVVQGSTPSQHERLEDRTLHRSDLGVPSIGTTDVNDVSVVVF